MSGVWRRKEGAAGGTGSLYSVLSGLVTLAGRCKKKCRAWLILLSNEMIEWIGKVL